MKALSLKQPWAELVVSGAKTVETRTWNTRFRGSFLVHASKSVDAAAMRHFGYSMLPTGCIVGSACVMSTKHYASREVFLADKTKHCVWSWRGPRYGYLLAKAKRCTPRPARGSLGFFTLTSRASRAARQHD